jgi:hypothetical protein
MLIAFRQAMFLGVAWASCGCVLHLHAQTAAATQPATEARSNPQTIQNDRLAVTTTGTAQAVLNEQGTLTAGTNLLGTTQSPPQDGSVEVRPIQHGAGWTWEGASVYGTGPLTLKVQGKGATASGEQQIALADFSLARDGDGMSWGARSAWNMTLVVHKSGREAFRSGPQREGSFSMKYAPAAATPAGDASSPARAPVTTQPPIDQPTAWIEVLDGGDAKGRATTGGQVDTRTIFRWDVSTMNFAVGATTSMRVQLTAPTILNATKFGGSEAIEADEVELLFTPTNASESTQTSLSSLSLAYQGGAAMQIRGLRPQTR